MFDKTKKFIKDHREEIAIAVVTTAVAVGCGVAYCYGCKIKAKELESNEAMKIINRVLGDIPESAKIRVYGGIIRSGLNPKELGALGEQMIIQGADELGDAFTHFIAIKKMDT